MRLPAGYLQGASSLEIAAALVVAASGIPLPVREFRFDPSRKWRADFAWPDQRVLLECEGGTWGKTNKWDGTRIVGRHGRGVGYDADCEKYNEATVQGWRVLRVTMKHVQDGSMVKWIKILLDMKVKS